MTPSLRPLSASRALLQQLKLGCFRSQYSNSIIILVREVDPAGSIDRDTCRKADFRVRRRPPITAESVNPVSRDRIDQARRRVDPPYAVIDGIRYVKISPLRSNASDWAWFRSRVRGWSAVAAESALANHHVKGR